MTPCDSPAGDGVGGDSEGGFGGGGDDDDDSDGDGDYGADEGMNEDESVMVSLLRLRQ